MSKQNRTTKNMTARIVTLLIVLTLSALLLTACSDAAFLGSSDLPEGTAALSLTDCINEDGTYYVLANAVINGNISNETYKIPLSQRFVGEFATENSDDASSAFFAGPDKFFTGSDFFDKKNPATANTFILNDSGELILLTDALPEAE